MKTRILLFLFISIYCATNVAAQPYESIFGSNSTEWVFTWWNSWGNVNDTVRVQKDTVMDGKVYKKIVAWSYSAALREDLDSGKVWHRLLDNNCSEELLFDFSLEVGDTFYPGPHPFTTYPDSCKIVDSVRYVDEKKYIYFKCDYLHYREPVTFMEGIGSNMGVIVKHCGAGSGVNFPYLLCSYKDGQKTTYNNRYYNGACWMFSRVEKPGHIEDDVTLYPQPASGSVNIRNAGGHKVVGVEIISPAGVSIRKLSSASSLTGVNIDGIPAGCYFVKLVTDKGYSATKAMLIK